MKNNIENENLTIYFNWLDEWILLSDNGLINNMVPNKFVDDFFQKNQSESNISIIEVENDGVRYYINSNQIVWKVEKIKNNDDRNKLPFPLQADEETESILF